MKNKPKTEKPQKNEDKKEPIKEEVKPFNDPIDW